LKLDSWEDKNTKQKQSKLKVVLESFNFIGGPREGGGGGGGSRPMASQSSAPASAPEPSEPDMPPSEPDDVPF
jgi:single-strand DNA-binding protein